MKTETTSDMALNLKNKFGDLAYDVVLVIIEDLKVSEKIAKNMGHEARGMVRGNLAWWNHVQNELHKK